MRKLLALSLLVGSMALGVSSASAAETASANSLSANANATTQIRIQDRRWNRRPRVYTQVRTVRVGRRVYRDTYRITVRPNGVTRSQLISRVVIR